MGEAVDIGGEEAVYEATGTEVYAGVVVGDADRQWVVLIGVDISPEGLGGLIGTAHIGIELTPCRGVCRGGEEGPAKDQHRRHQQHPADDPVGPVGLPQSMLLLLLLTG